MMDTTNADRGNGRASAAVAKRLERVTFKTSREVDFFSERELVTQTGHGKDEWPLVIVKELLDNALDACEEADIAPVISVTADAGGITVSDNGPGLPETTLKAALNFAVRASSREAYVSPCRGAQGNALKTLLPMPWVLDPSHGKMVVTAHGKRHEITCGADPISQRAVVNDDATDLAKSKNLQTRGGKIKQVLSGTTVRLEWSPREAGADEDGPPPAWELWPFDFDPFVPRRMNGLFRGLVEGFAVFNPHATITLDWFGEKTTWQATDPAWKKWKPHQPTSPHWYELRHLERLIGAYITHEREVGADRLVSEFIAEFDGLTGSGKRTKVLTEAGLKRAKLSDLVRGGRLDSERIALLLAAMQEHTRPVNPKLLGMIGEDHLSQRLLAMGVVPESFAYEREIRPAKSKKSQPRPDGKAKLYRAAHGDRGGLRLAR
jgi:DNA topoisomerase VI subunit B